jgi:glycosyltransferase involved in cell wall biosynthesis
MDMTLSSVLLVTPRWTRDGGVATHVQASAAALAQRGVEVHVLAARVEGAGVAGVTLHHSPSLCRENASREERIGDAAELSPDVVHAHQFEDPAVLAHLHVRSPLLISVHGYSACTSGVHYFRPGHECERAHGAGCIPNLLLRGCAHTRNPSRLPASYRRVSRDLQALRGADLVVSYSSAVERHLAANGVTRRALVPLFVTIPAAGGGSSRRRVLFAGRVIRAKGVHVLLAAAQHVEAEFVICGDGRELERMRALARRLHADERVRFTGWLPPRELARELADAAVVVVPSLWPEPAGLAGIEAHAAARPVIASDTGGVRDWLEDGVNGRLVRAGDASHLARALRELLDDPRAQQEMGEAGRRIVGERFTAERHVAALVSAYERARARWEHAQRHAGARRGGRSRASVAGARS